MANWTFDSNDYTEREFALIPEGDHRVRITKVVEKVFNSGKEGFEITMQKACETGDKVYTVIAASYAETAHIPEEIFTYTGRLNPHSEPADRKYLEGQIRMLKKQGMGDSRYTLLADQITERLENL